MAACIRAVNFRPSSRSVVLSKTWTNSVIIRNPSVNHLPPTSSLHQHFKCFSTATQTTPKKTVPIELVKDLRKRTGAGPMDCSKALVETDMDMDKAVEWLRKKGIMKAASKADRFVYLLVAKWLCLESLPRVCLAWLFLLITKLPVWSRYTTRNMHRTQPTSSSFRV